MNRFFGKAKPKAPPPSLTDCIGTVREGRGLGWGGQGAVGGQELLWKKAAVENRLLPKLMFATGY